MGAIQVEHIKIQIIICYINAWSPIPLRNCWIDHKLREILCWIGAIVVQSHYRLSNTIVC